MLTKIITYLEQAKIPYRNYFITFFCLTILRDFFEFFAHTSSYNFFNFPSTEFAYALYHCTASYIFIALILALVVNFITQEKVSKIIKILLPGFAILLSVPLVDMVVSPEHGVAISYLFPSGEHSLLYYYITYFGDYRGVTFGVRLEIFLVSLSGFAYFRIKKQSIVKSIFGACLIYSAIFMAFVSPYIVKIFVPTIATSSMALNYLTDYYLATTFFLSILLAYRTDKQIFLAIFKDMRWLRLLHFELMLVFGMTVAAGTPDFWSIKFLFTTMAILFFWLFSVMTNNLADQDIDRICNATRPLVTNTIEPKIYKTTAYIVFACSLIYASAVNFITLAVICGVVAAYYLYSMPPFRLKRVFLFSKMIIAMISLALVFLGFYTVDGSIKLFPRALIWIFLIGYTLTLNFIDIKDYVGDKASHIMTLPVVLGQKVAKMIIGLSFFFTGLAFSLYLKNIYILSGLLLVGGLGFYYINQKDYREWKIFAVYLGCMVCFICKLLIDKFT